MKDQSTAVLKGVTITPPVETFTPLDVVIERADDHYMIRFVTPFKIYSARVGKDDGHAMSRILSPLYVAPEDTAALEVAQ